MRSFTLIMLGMLAGCSTVAPAPARVSNTEPACAAVARQRQLDAAENGYDADIQARTGRDAYAVCLGQKGQLSLAGN